MKKALAIAALASLATAGAQSVELGLTAGYANGLSGELFVHAPNVAGPVGVKVGVSMTRPVDSINDSNTPAAGVIPTFGDLKKPTSQGGLGATEYGSHTVASVDATYGLGEFAPGADAMVYAGGRYGMFKSTEDYGSSAGRTTYSANSFGIGFGSMASYALSGNLSLVGDLGVDYFFKNGFTYTGYNGAGVAQPCVSGNANTVCQSTANDPLDNRFVRPGVVFKARIGVKTSF